MAEPTTSGAAALAASISGVTLALIGVEYHALLWAFVGAMMSMASVPSLSMGKAIWRVVLTTLIGAALGSGALSVLEITKPAALIVLSLLCGAGADRIVGKAIDAIAARIDKLGGGS